jgi:hypothetical protein
MRPLFRACPSPKDGLTSANEYPYAMAHVARRSLIFPLFEAAGYLQYQQHLLTKSL